MQRAFLSNEGSPLTGRLAADAVLEVPFAAPGRPRRIVGGAAIEAHTSAARAGFPVRFEECRNVVVHETADPQVIVVEYELVGSMPTADGERRAAAPFIGVLHVRDGEIALWREYQDTLAIAHALGQLPALVDAIASAPIRT
jgi:uncharacterized protein